MCIAPRLARGAILLCAPLDALPGCDAPCQLCLTARAHRARLVAWRGLLKHGVAVAESCPHAQRQVERCHESVAAGALRPLLSPHAPGQESVCQAEGAPRRRMCRRTKSPQLILVKGHRGQRWSAGGERPCRSREMCVNRSLRARPQRETGRDVSVERSAHRA